MGSASLRVGFFALLRFGGAVGTRGFESLEEVGRAGFEPAKA